jgi:hypothetical protein
VGDDYRIPIIREMANSGLSQPKIAAHFDVTPVRISQLMGANGIDPGGHPGRPRVEATAQEFSASQIGVNLNDI